MRRLFAGFAVSAIVFGAFVVVAPEELSANPGAAVVFNQGRDGMTCALSGTWTGTGGATYVSNDGGRINFTCSGNVVSGPLPSSAVVTTASGPGGPCALRITPSGRFSASCTN